MTTREDRKAAYTEIGLEAGCMRAHKAALWRVHEALSDITDALEQLAQDHYDDDTGTFTDPVGDAADDLFYQMIEAAGNVMEAYNALGKIEWTLE